MGARDRRSKSLLGADDVAHGCFLELFDPTGHIRCMSGRRLHQGHRTVILGALEQLLFSQIFAVQPLTVGFQSVTVTVRLPGGRAPACGPAFGQQFCN